MMLMSFTILRFPSYFRAVTSKVGNFFKPMLSLYTRVSITPYGFPKGTSFNAADALFTTL